ncbi:MAG: hypothetical protein M1135_01985 [Candidatus Omnitrophica bacterium]|nr:hypothetical protein [Candidatus Omnitrophota bacterium]
MNKMKKLSVFFCLFLIFGISVFARNTFTLNFNNVDIKTFIKLVGEFTGKNYVIAQNVNGNITIFSQKPVPVDKLPQIFDAILNIYGYAAFERDGMDFIIPSTEARIKGVDVNTGAIPENKYDSYFTQIIPLKYYPSNLVSQLLNPYLSRSGLISFDTRSNTIFVSDFGVNIQRIMDIVAVIDKPTPPGKETMHVYKLKNAKAEDVSKVLTQILARERVPIPVSMGGAPPVQPMVVPDTSANSLIIYAEPEQYVNIKNLIKQLDIMPKQVLIEALIVEATADTTKQLGIEWADTNQIQNAQYTEFGGTNFGVLQNLAATGVPPTGLSLGFFKGTSLTSPFSVGALINLMQNNTSFHIESAPQIVTADNQKASINVSENVPYLTQSTVLTGTGTTGAIGNTVNSYNYKDVGTMLTITPQICQNNYVRLALKQDVTKIVQGAGPSGTITTEKRQIETTLLVPNGKTIVLGGLIGNERNNTIQKVPLLGDIPLLGNLFKYRNTDEQRTNLMVFITPHILSNFDEAQEITQKKEKLMQKKEKQIKNEQQ